MAVGKARKVLLLVPIVTVTIYGQPAGHAAPPAPAAKDQPAQVSDSAAPGSSAPQGKLPSMFDPNSAETQSLVDANRRAARDNLFVKYLLLSCATIGAIIALAVWRSMPPKPKANTEQN